MIQIERSYHVDLDLEAKFDEEVTTWAEEISTGLLVTWELVVPIFIGDKRINAVGTVRFYGPRNVLVELVNRATGSIEDETVGEYARRMSGAVEWNASQR